MHLNAFLSANVEFSIADLRKKIGWDVLLPKHLSEFEIRLINQQRYSHLPSFRSERTLG